LAARARLPARSRRRATVREEVSGPLPLDCTPGAEPRGPCPPEGEVSLEARHGPPRYWECPALELPSSARGHTSGVGLLHAPRHARTAPDAGGRHAAGSRARCAEHASALADACGCGARIAIPTKTARARSAAVDGEHWVMRSLPIWEVVRDYSAGAVPALGPWHWGAPQGSAKEATAPIPLAPRGPP
jgi:hypothetical protein